MASFSVAVHFDIVFIPIHFVVRFWPNHTSFPTLPEKLESPDAGCQEPDRDFGKPQDSYGRASFIGRFW